MTAEMRKLAGGENCTPRATFLEGNSQSLATRQRNSPRNERRSPLSAQHVTRGQSGEHQNEKLDQPTLAEQPRQMRHQCFPKPKSGGSAGIVPTHPPRQPSRQQSLPLRPNLNKERTAARFVADFWEIEKKRFLE